MRLLLLIIINKSFKYFAMIFTWWMFFLINNILSYRFSSHNTKFMYPKKFCRNVLLLFARSPIPNYFKRRSASPLPKAKKCLTWMSLSIFFLFAGKLCRFWHQLYLNACRFPKFKFAVCISVLCWSMSGLC